jgi:hypothetical protein
VISHSRLVSLIFSEGGREGGHIWLWSLSAFRPRTLGRVFYTRGSSVLAPGRQVLFSEMRTELVF